MDHPIRKTGRTGVFAMSRIDAKRMRVRSMLRQRPQPCSPGSVLKVDELMTHSPVSVEASTTALELAQLFYSLRFRHFLVKDENGKLIGLISDHDFVRCFGVNEDPSEEQLASVNAGQLMSTELVAISPST